ncbi:MAG: hypothetical protein HOJ11_05705 [Gammaproteobacteria bacterium]|jgi:hypothetical protein|nr:hypothetical protein [Gammaproteobacteria bacterium]
MEASAQPSSLSKSPGDFAYQRHKPEETNLYTIIEKNLSSFQSHLSNAEISLPSFVHEEFRSYLRCGILKHGFLRVKYSGCRFEHLVAFSCKHRGFCPSCGARRMVETSAHLIDHVMPTVPVRQWMYRRTALKTIGAHVLVYHQSQVKQSKPQSNPYKIADGKGL